MRESRFHKFDILAIIGALIFLIVLLYTLRAMLSPLILTFAILLLLIPFRGRAVVNSLIVLTVFLFLVWFVSHTRSILTPFFISFVLAYLFDPVIDKLEKLKLSRSLAILLVVLFITGIFVLALLFLIPQLVKEIKDLINQSISYAPRIKTWFETDILAIWGRLNLDTEKIKQSLLAQLPTKIQTFLQTFLKSALDITSSISALISQILNFILLPFLTFYFLRDYDRIKRHVKDLIPEHRKKGVIELTGKIEMVLNGYIRGQLIVCLIVAILTTTGLFISGINYAFVLGLTAGVLNLIPYIGLIISLALALVVGLFSASPLIACLKIALVFGVVQSLEGSVISPKIVGDKVGLHPVWVIFSILILSHFWGFLGLLVAVPVAAIIKILIKMAYFNYITEKTRTA